MKLLTCVLLFLCSYFESVESKSSSYCPTPVIKNGRFRYRHRARFVKYTCNVGFILYGDRYNNCHHGKWDGPPPKCVRQGCKKVDPLTNGMIYPSHMWSVLHFFCKSGFEVHGPNVTYCDGKTWSSSRPICIPSNTKPSLSCDFEQPDLCGWTHDLNHDFYWMRMQFTTPSGSIGTGPSHDHTLGSGKAGYYMYIESSSKNVNDTARLVSPVYEKTTDDTCFLFYYHMYGSTIGTLRVYLRMINETSSLKPSKAFFEKSGNQGDKWIRSIHLFEGIPKDYQIIIEGVRGDGYVSDIAIDDVSIIPNCNLAEFEDQELSTTTETEEYTTTDFLPDDLYSCEGRCFSSEIQMGKHRTCACDENCYDRNQCCPDYIDFCLNQGSTDQSTETTLTTLPPTVETTSTTTYRIPTTQRKNMSTTQTNSEYTKQKTTNLNVPTITTKIQTTTQFVVKTTKTPPKHTTQTPVKPTTTEAPTTKLTTKKHIKETKPTTTTEDNELEIFTDDFENFLETTTDIGNDIPNYPDDYAEIEDIAHLKRNSNEKIVISKREEEKSTILPYILVSMCVVVAGFIAVFVRRRMVKKSRRFRSGSHGGSASDVRFLTSDELLDLNLDY